MPRRDFLLDENGNRLLVNGDTGFADGIQAVKQGIRCRVALFKGEYWLNTGKGVDWLGKILIRNANPPIVKAELAAAIADTPDVTRVRNVSFSVDTKKRAGATTYEASSTEGTVAGDVIA